MPTTPELTVPWWLNPGAVNLEVANKLNRLADEVEALEPTIRDVAIRCYLALAEYDRSEHDGPPYAPDDVADALDQLTGARRLHDTLHRLAAHFDAADGENPDSHPDWLATAKFVSALARVQSGREVVGIANEHRQQVEALDVPPGAVGALMRLEEALRVAHKEDSFYAFYMAPYMAAHYVHAARQAGATDAQIAEVAKDTPYVVEGLRESA